MKITREMVMELNNELANKGCSFRYEYDEAGYLGNPHMKIVLPSMNYVNHFYISLTKEFYDWLNLWFKIKGIELSYNNDRSILWSKSGWDTDNKGNNVVEEVSGEEIKKLFKGSHFDYGYYAYLDKNGKFVIGEERGREGGVLYRGEYKREDTPFLYDLKEENAKLYNSIVNYFGA